MGRMIDADALEQKLGMLGVSNAFDRPSFWYGKDKKDYKVIPTKYHNGYDNALADVEKAIQELPTIEERKGKWIDDGQYADYHSEHGFHCSVCGGCIIDYVCQVYDENPHCKWCGTKMEGAEE